MKNDKILDDEAKKQALLDMMAEKIQPIEEEDFIFDEVDEDTAQILKEIEETLKVDDEGD